MFNSIMGAMIDYFKGKELLRSVCRIAGPFVSGFNCFDSKGLPVIFLALQQILESLLNTDFFITTLTSALCSDQVMGTYSGITCKTIHLDYSYIGTLYHISKVAASYLKITSNRLLFTICKLQKIFRF